VGKTHLARRFLAQRDPRGPREAVLCELAAARTAAEVSRAVATTLGLERADPRPLEAPAAVGELLARRPSLLLVLDNLEQALPAAREVVTAWLEAAPGLALVATSREPLGVPGETCVELAPLPAADALALFTAAARAVRPIADDAASRRDLRRIVDRLDRLPLALELAAGRLVVLGLPELLARLDQPLELLRARGGRPARHLTLEAAVGWSWDLLSPAEQRALACCAVFRGAFSPAAAEALLADAPGLEVSVRERPLELLEGLRLRALLQVEATAADGSRLRLYQAVQAFAGDRLDELGLRTQAERRHAEVLLAGLEVGASAGDAAPLARLALEADDLLAIHQRFLEAEPSLAARALLALHPLLLLRGPFQVHTDALDALLAPRRARAYPAAPALEARLRLARGEVLRVRGRVAEAGVELERAGRLARAARERATEIAAQRLLGAVARMQGRLAEALRLHRGALRLARGRRAPEAAREVALCVGELGATLAAAGRLREACRQHRAALDLHRRAGDRWLEGVQLSHLGVATHRLGRAEEARRLHLAALELHREVGNRRLEAADTCHLAFVEHQLGLLDDARGRFAAALELCGLVCDRRLEAIARSYLADLETEAGEVARARALLDQALGFHEGADDRQQQALCWLHLAFAQERAGQLEEALLALRSAATLAAPSQVWVRSASHAHAAALRRRLEDKAGTRREARLARRRAGALENPYQLAAVLLLAEGTAPNAGAREGERSSSELRRALRWSQRGGTARELWVGPGAAWVSLGDARIDLSRRGPMRRVLLALVEAAAGGERAGLPWHGLAEAGWPGEKMQPEAALQRVYTAVWSLRKLGLEPVLVCREGSYQLDPSFAVRRFDER